VVAIQKRLVKWGGRNVVFRSFHAKGGKKTIAAWKLDLDKILQVFKVCSVIRVKIGANPPIPEGIYNKLNRVRRPE